jgi:hypothetical protein
MYLKFNRGAGVSKYCSFYFKKKTQLFYLLLFFCFSCKKNSPELVKAKSFALAPKDYENVEVSISGKITALGSGSAFYIIEDDTGKIMVSTEKINSSVKCNVGDLLKAVGALKVLPENLGQYFSITRLESCD